MNNDSFYNGKSVLITGGAGFVGTHLIRYLKSLGANITATIYEKKPQIVETGVNYLKCDLTKNSDCLKVTRNIDYVFMTAANSSGAEVMQTTPLVHLTPNIVMNSQMLAASYENKVKKFCFISSNTVYPVTDFAVTEEDANYDYFHKYFIVG
jgi:nucleoside-diphosphate-sugar epimerase